MGRMQVILIVKQVLVLHFLSVVQVFHHINERSTWSGLNFFTPNINLVRDPRWGHGDDERYLKVAATCKHFVGYDLEKWNSTDRFHFNAMISDQDIVETYLPLFERCIRDAQVASIMCSFNSINGIPACVNQFLWKLLHGKTNT